MNTLHDDMNQVVGRFVATVTELARREALTTLEAAFGGRGPALLSIGARGATARPVGRPAGRGLKRRAEDLAALSDKVVSFVKTHPGLRIEQINKELGTTTKDLALPIRKLVAEGIIRTKGHKRSTMYLPGRKG